MSKKQEIGPLIRQLRLSKNMTQSELAKCIGQSPSSITMYETGRRFPDYETLEALADVFNVPLVLLNPEEEIYAQPNRDETYVQIKDSGIRTLALDSDGLSEKNKRFIESIVAPIIEKLKEQEERDDDHDDDNS